MHTSHFLLKTKLVVVPPLQVFPVATKKVIHSFPNGSAGGPDGLRTQHLKYLFLGASEDHPLLLANSDLSEDVKKLAERFHIQCSNILDNTELIEIPLKS